MFKTKCDLQIEIYIIQKIVRDIISKTVLKIEVCYIYKISSMLLFFKIMILVNTSILWINAAQVNMIDL